MDAYVAGPSRSLDEHFPSDVGSGDKSELTLVRIEPSAFKWKHHFEPMISAVIDKLIQFQHPRRFRQQYLGLNQVIVLQ